jgi:hypothetical protein
VKESSEIVSGLLSSDGLLSNEVTKPSSSFSIFLLLLSIVSNILFLVLVL